MLIIIEFPKIFPSLSGRLVVIDRYRATGIRYYYNWKRRRLNIISTSMIELLTIMIVYRMIAPVFELVHNIRR